jgi:hypothetical protein
MTLFQQIRGLFATPSHTERGDSAGSIETRDMDGGDLEQKSSAAWQALFASEEWNRGNNGLADPYNLSPWVSRAIKTIAQPIAQVDLDFSIPSGGSEVKIDDAEVAAFWNRPGKGMGQGVRGRLSRFDVIEATVGWLCLKGSFFWLLDDTWLDPRLREKSPFIVARPDRMRRVTDDGELVGWCYTDANGRRHDLIPDQVITSSFWNPMDEGKGSAPMDSARQAAESDYAAGSFWKSLSEANGDLGETVIAPNGIAPEQAEQIKLAMRRKREAARKGKFIPRFLIGDLKTEDPKIQSPDASSVTQRLQNRHEVYIAFGVPPSFAEVVQSYSIGSASDRYKLIEETCQPIGTKISEAAELVESMRTTRRPVVCARFNFENHSTMQQVRAERMETGKKMHERGIPWQVINDHLKLGLDPFPGWDVAWLPFNLQAVGVPAAAPEPVAIAPVKSNGLTVLDELEDLIRACPAHGEQRIGGGEVCKKWEGYMLTRAPHIKAMRVSIDKALFNARRSVLAKIAAAETADKAVRSGAFDFIFDLIEFTADIIKPMTQLIFQAYVSAGDELMETDMESADPFIPADPKGLAWLRARENHLKDASTEVWNDVRDQLDEGIQAGESYAKLSERVRTTFNGISKTASLRIAKTETSVAFETGRNEAMVQAGVQWKQWITSGLENVRATHSALNLKRVAIDKPFNVGGFLMMYPCDPTGPAKEVINCNCIHGPVRPPKEPTMDDIEGNNPDAGIPF